jgi:uncharacterized protein YdeI (YjbR/CyaY-like superfamily)
LAAGQQRVTRSRRRGCWDIVTLELASVKKEPEPDIPADFQEALAATPEARHAWNNTTTIARVDWIHWITSATQLKTRAKRISDACDMLASGKKHVCCFDQSGYYSKAFRAPKADNSDGADTLLHRSR